MNLLIQGFRAAITDNLEAELAAMEAAVLTPGQGDPSVPMQPTADELKKLSSRYHCSVKTLRRLTKRGVDVTDPAAVAIQLAGQRVVSIPMLEQVSKLIP